MITLRSLISGWSWFAIFTRRACQAFVTRHACNESNDLMTRAVARTLQQEMLKHLRICFEFAKVHNICAMCQVNYVVLIHINTESLFADLVHNVL